MAKGIDPAVFSLMQSEKPVRTYIKTILAKAHVMVLDPFSGEPKGIILEGNPKNEKDTCTVDVWSDAEDSYFRRANKKLFDIGHLTVYVRKASDAPVKSVNELSDEELDEVLNSPFLKLQNVVGKFTSTAPLARLIIRAKELEKSEKIIRVLETKLSELQLQEFGAPVEE